MDYFFDAAAGVNFGGGEFDFASQPGSSSLGLASGSSIFSSPSVSTLPDFSSPSLDPHQQQHPSSYGFYGNSSASAESSLHNTQFSSPWKANDSDVDHSSLCLSADKVATESPSVSASSSSSHPESLTSSTGESAVSSSLASSSTKEDDAAFPEASTISPRDDNDMSLRTLADSNNSRPDERRNDIDDQVDFEKKGVADGAEAEEEETAETAAKEDEEPTIDININNVVCAFSVRCHLNLRKIAMEACNTEYYRNRACVKMKLRKPKITASIWNSGKITCIGATSEEDSKIGARRVARILMRMGFNVHFCRFRVVNVLASLTMPFAIRLHKFSAKYPQMVEYEPELHPAATYRIKHPKATLKIFSTGSITITAPLVSCISPAVEHIYPIVREFRMDEKDKESGEMANLGAKAFVPLNTKHGRIKHIPKGPFHSKFKQVIHQKDLVKKAIQQVKDNESSDEDAMYMGCDEDDVNYDQF